MPQIVPDLVWDKTLPFPLNHTWGYHDACSGNGHWEQYYREMVKRYGEPESMEDFCNKMQLMNAIGYQGIFEAAGHKLNDIGGVMLWKINAAFPSVVWQVYDWFLMPNAGYYFMQNACEPVHIQLNPVDKKVTVLNRTYKPVSNLIAIADVYNLESKSIFHESSDVNLGPTDVKESISLDKVLEGSKGVTFIVLRIKDRSGKVISHNTYWIASDGDYKPLNKMEITSVNASILKTENSKVNDKWTVRITNSSDKIAFFIRPQVMAGGKEVLPSFWSESYFTLAPYESITINVTCPLASLGNSVRSLKVTGWNVEERSYF